MPALVRRAGRRDLEGIQGLWERLREHEAQLDNRLQPSASAAKLAGEHREVVLGDPRTAFFVCEDGGEIVAFLHAEIEQGDRLQGPERLGRLVDLFVVPDQRRRRLASQLVDYCHEWFDSHNVQQIRMAAPSALPDAARFLEQRGARALHTLYTLSLPEDDL